MSKRLVQMLMEDALYEGLGDAVITMMKHEPLSSEEQQKIRNFITVTERADIDSLSMGSIRQVIEEVDEVMAARGDNINSFSDGLDVVDKVIDKIETIECDDRGV